MSKFGLIVEIGNSQVMRGLEIGEIGSRERLLLSSTVWHWGLGGFAALGGIASVIPSFDLCDQTFNMARIALVLAAVLGLIIFASAQVRLALPPPPSSSIFTKPRIFFFD